MNTTRDSHITATPVKKAMATLTKMAMITLSALSLLSSASKVRLGSACILSRARINVPPRSSNTSDTVVEVGSPSVLNMSSTMTSVTMTARKMVITSWNE